MSLSFIDQKKVSKVFIYALIHPLIENDVKYVGMTIDPKTILQRMVGTRPVSRWCQFLHRQNTDPQIMILSEVSIENDPNTWRETRQYWVDKFRRDGHQLFNRLHKLPKYSKSELSAIMKQASRKSWTEDRRLRFGELSKRLAPIRKAKGKKRRALVADLMRLVKWERFSEHLAGMSTKRERLIDDLMELVLSDEVSGE